MWLESGKTKVKSNCCRNASGSSTVPTAPQLPQPPCQDQALSPFAAARTREGRVSWPHFNLLPCVCWALSAAKGEGSSEKRAKKKNKVSKQEATCISTTPSSPNSNPICEPIEAFFSLQSFVSVHHSFFVLFLFLNILWPGLLVYPRTSQRLSSLCSFEQVSEVFKSTLLTSRSRLPTPGYPSGLIWSGHWYPSFVLLLT